MADGVEVRRARKLRSEQRLAGAAVPSIAIQEFVLDETEGPAAREARRTRLEQRAAAEKAKHDAMEAERLRRVAAAAEKRRAERLANGEMGPEAKRKKAAEKEARNRAALNRAWDERAAKWRAATEKTESDRVAAEEESRKLKAELAEAEMERRLAAEKQLEAEERRVKIWRQTGQSEATASQMSYLGKEGTETVKSWGWMQLENGKFGYGFTRGGDQVNKTLMALGIDDIRLASAGALALQDQDPLLALKDAGPAAPCLPASTIATSKLAQCDMMPAESMAVPQVAPLETQPAEMLEQKAVGEGRVSPFFHGMSEAKVHADMPTLHAAGDSAANFDAANDSTAVDDVSQRACAVRSSSPHCDAINHNEEETHSIVTTTVDGFEVGVSNGIGGEQATVETSRPLVAVVSLPIDDVGRSARDARQVARYRRIADVVTARRARVAQRRIRQGADGLGKESSSHFDEETS